MKKKKKHNKKRKQKKTKTKKERACVHTDDKARPKTADSRQAGEADKETVQKKLQRK